jgi:Fe-S-cluster-containing dehydrogenase component
VRLIQNSARLRVHRALRAATVVRVRFCVGCGLCVVACASQVSGMAVIWVRCDARWEWGGDGSRLEQRRIDVCEDVDMVGVG